LKSDSAVVSFVQSSPLVVPTSDTDSSAVEQRCVWSRLSMQTGLLKFWNQHIPCMTAGVRLPAFSFSNRPRKILRFQVFICLGDSTIY